MDQLLAGLNRRRFLGAVVALGATTILPGRSRAAEAADVIVVGAGLSGLQAAIILASEGAKPLVLEADTRPGGRIRTLYDAPGRPEAGGSEIGPLYARTRRLISDMNLMLVDRPAVPSGMAIHAGGRLIHPRDWPHDAANHLPGGLHALPPAALEGALMSRAVPLADSELWLTPEAALRDGPYDELLRTLGADEPALAMIQQNASEPLAETSALWMLRRDQIRRQSGSLGTVEVLSGGMSRLTDAMAESLGDRVRYGETVAAIHQDEAGVVVETQDGRRYAAARALVTVPLPVLRGIRFDPLPPSVQQAAWAAVPYGQAACFFFPVTGRYWEEDGLPPSIWSDSLPGRAFLVGNEAGQHLWFYAQGKRSIAFQSAPAGDALSEIMHMLIACRPSLEGRIKQGAGWSWTANPRALGTFASRRPGGLDSVQQQLKAAHGRIAFAGEHSADLNSGIEGALESGERAAIEILF